MNSNNWLGSRFELRAEVRRRFGRIVFRAKDVALGRRVLIVVAAAGDTVVFRGAMRAAARLRSPYTLPLLEYHDDVARPFAVMEWPAGVPLRSHLDGGWVFSLDKKLQIAAQLTAAVQDAHRQGLIHGALDAHCIWVHSGPYVQVDFATTVERRSARPGPSVDRPANAFGGRTTDIRACGRLLNELFLGRRLADPSAPYVRAADTAAEEGREALSVLLPPRLLAVLRRAVAAASEPQFETISELASELRAIRAHVRHIGLPPERFQTLYAQSLDGGPATWEHPHGPERS